jgi:hypothetical protein
MQIMSYSPDARSLPAIGAATTDCPQTLRLCAQRKEGVKGEEMGQSSLIIGCIGPHKMSEIPRFYLIEHGLCFFVSNK